MSFVREKDPSRLNNLSRPMFRASISLLCFILLISEKSGVFSMWPQTIRPSMEMMDGGRSSQSFHSAFFFPPPSFSTRITEPTLRSNPQTAPGAYHHITNPNLFDRRPPKYDPINPNPPTETRKTGKFLGPKARSKLKHIILKAQSLLQQLAYKLGNFIKFLFRRRAKKPGAPSYPGGYGTESDFVPMLHSEMEHPNEVYHASDGTSHTAELADLQKIHATPENTLNEKQRLDNRGALSKLKDIKLTTPPSRGVVLVQIKELPGYLTSQKFIKADGNCLYRAFAFYTTGNQNNYPFVRENMITYIEANAQRFKQFISKEDLTSGVERSQEEMLKEYCEMMSQDKVYGDNLSIITLQEQYDINIAIVSHSRESISTVLYQSETGTRYRPWIGLYLKDEHYELLYAEPQYPEIIAPSNIHRARK